VQVSVHPNDANIRRLQRLLLHPKRLLHGKKGTTLQSLQWNTGRR